jgi:hypothetical protein
VGRKALAQADDAAVAEATNRRLAALRAVDPELKAVLLLDYSGSMYGGYDRPEVPGCARCAASTSARTHSVSYSFSAAKAGVVFIE